MKHLNEIQKGDDLILLIDGEERPFTVAIVYFGVVVCENQSDAAIFGKKGKGLDWFRNNPNSMYRNAPLNPRIVKPVVLQ